MPAITHAELALGGTPPTARSYHHFPFSHVCTGLAILGILVILRFVAYGVFRSTTGKKDEKARRDEPGFDSLSHLVNQQRLHHLFIQDRGWVMEEKSRGVSSNTKVAENRSAGKTGSNVSFMAGNETESGEIKEKGNSNDLPSMGNMFGPGNPSGLTSTRFMLSMPPPPPPLTPPELSPSVFTYDSRRRSFTSGISELDASFFEQPNPDYMSSTSAATSTATQSTRATRSSPMPRRRSYTKTLPIDMPASAAGPMFDEAGIVFSPSSYPPTSPLLPGPPPIYGEIRYDEATKQEILVQGEIISVLDDAGAGWKRHTRVYGGGVCLACAASGNDGHHGGFYGENVLPEEKRY